MVAVGRKNQGVRETERKCGGGGGGDGSVIDEGLEEEREESSKIMGRRAYIEPRLYYTRI